jgi:peroxiredoxin
MIKQGDKVPATTLRKMNTEGMREISTQELCSGKRVVLFAVPGAFTPTCSARHLPGFIEKAAEIKRKGVDQIVCLSVNDPFVMHEWGRVQKVPEDVELLSDGNAEFTKAVGLSFEAANYGMGTRSQRYAMIIRDGVVEALFVELPGQFEVSSAEYILAKL